MGDGVYGYDIFSRRPREESKVIPWPIIRVPGKGSLIGQILSHDLTGAYLHYAGDRSVPCNFSDTCPGCRAGIEARWYGYFAATLSGKIERAFVEVPKGGVGFFDEAFCRFRTLRGLVFECHRRPARKTGTVYTRFREAKPGTESLPSCPDLLKQLLNMWGVPALLQMEHPAGRSRMEAEALREERDRRRQAKGDTA